MSNAPMAHSGLFRRTLPGLLAALAAGGALAIQPQDPAKSPAQGGFWIGADPAPAGTVPWQLLQSTKTIQKADKKFGPSFPKEVKDLDKQQVKLFGFMMPLDQAKKQKRFLLSAFPPHCSFCLTGGPESLVEVLADKPIDFTFEPVVVAGRMAVLDDDIVYYRLTNAVAVKP
jgi:uncharacterized protein